MKNGHVIIRHSWWSILKLKALRWFAYLATRILYGDFKGVRKEREKMYAILRDLNNEILDYEAKKKDGKNV